MVIFLSQVNFIPKKYFVQFILTSFKANELTKKKLQSQSYLTFTPHHHHHHNDYLEITFRVSRKNLESSKKLCNCTRNALFFHTTTSRTAVKNKEHKKKLK